jgi:hypothetical protein
MAKPETSTVEGVLRAAAHEQDSARAAGQERRRAADLQPVEGGTFSAAAVSASAGEPQVSAADREIHDKAAAYDAFLDALGDDMDRRLAEISATLDRLAA